MIDGSTDQTRFLYNALQSSYSTDKQVIHSTSVDRTVGPSISGPAISHKRPPSHIGQHTSKEEVHNEAMEEPKKELDEAEEALKDDNSELDDDGDGKEPSGESLQSQDTPRRRGELGNMSNDSEDKSYDPDEPSDEAEGLTELELLSKEEEDESIDFEEIQQLCNANAKWNEVQERDAKVAGPGTALGINAAQISQVGAVHTSGERTKVETCVSTKAG